MSLRELPPLLRRKLYLLVVALLLLITLALAWSSTPMRAWLDVDLVVGSLRRFGQAFGPVAAVCGFALALTLAVPLLFLTLVALVAYGPMAGFGCVMAGAMLGAAASYGIGRMLGREVVQRVGGERVNRLSQRLASRGLLAVVAMRMLPVAPFAVVNMVAGASHIRLRDLLLGTLIGISPGTLAMTLFVDQISAALQHPTLLTFVLAGLTIVLIVVGLWALQRWLRNHDQA
ncbi:MAG: TVP38/TMEM64 family protein [Rhodoferax sp.]|nr:TVP38/TMEM64 family protein [Rhodoferax sp.]